MSFEAHAARFERLIGQRTSIVADLEELLNARRKPEAYFRDRARLGRLIDDAFCARDADPDRQAAGASSLEEARRASGFEPRDVPGLFNELIHPAEMVIRGFHCWHRTRWPGRNARGRYAQTLFDCYLLRQLELLSLRIWDGDGDAEGDRLERLQIVLDRLRDSAPEDQTAFVRDARWLIPLAQSPTTDSLAPYFDVSARIAGSFAPGDRIEIRKASVKMIAGHLRSQMRHYCLNENVALDDSSVVLRTRTSNALDFGLLVQGLVPLLDAYRQAAGSGGEAARLDLADAILQGMSPDPELFLNDADLLHPYSMIDYLFIASDRGSAEYTPHGERHVGLLREYADRVEDTFGQLAKDCARFDPAGMAYSPYGAIYGTPSNLTEDMALKTLQRDAEAGFSLEDAFTSGGDDKLAWINGLRDLPHVPSDVRARYEYPADFAAAVFQRIERAFEAPRGRPGASGSTTRGRLFVGRDRGFTASSVGSDVAALPVRYVVSSDSDVVSADRAEACEQSRLLRDRQEGYFLVSYRSDGGWTAIRKDFLTELVAAGDSVRIDWLPEAATDVVALMCPGLAVRDASVQASAPPSMLNA